MAISKAEKVQIIKDLKKETDIHSVLEELLPEMGYGDVYVTHEKGNKGEDGKDLICSYTNSIDDSKEWLAFVVKKGIVAGKSAVIQEIIAQTKDCFNTEYKNVIKGLRIRINKVKVVTNDHFSSEAERKIRESNDYRDANIAFWDAETIVGFIDRYYPKFWLKGSKQYKKYVDGLSEVIKVDNVAKSIGFNSSRIEKMIHNAIEPRVLERVEQEDGTFSWKTKNITSITKIPDNSIIVGEPGAGKSTLFKLLAQDVIEQNSLRSDSEFYPILLTFRDLKYAGFKLEKAFHNYFSLDWNKDLAIQPDQLLKQNNCVIFIDALDELANDKLKEDALSSINDFSSKYPSIKIVCSSRPSDYVSLNSKTLGFKYLEIAPLNREQINQFVSSFYSDNVVKSKRLLKSLRDSRILEKLPHTPMTIALIAMIFDEKEVEIPATITDLYTNFVNILIGRYTADKALELIEIGAKHRLLSNIAFELHSHRKQSISMDDLKRHVDDYTKARGQEIDSNAIIEDIISNTGLLFINQEGKIQFKHLSFQEYFTAYDIYHHNHEESKLFINNFNDSWWQNVAIFFAGMSKDAPKLLEEILDKSKPTSFLESVSNTMGIGKLLQALFNTPIESREKGITRGLENTIECLSVASRDGEKYGFPLNRISKFTLMQLFGALFSYSFWSITLVNPLKNVFKKMITRIDDDREETQQFEYEYQLYLLCSILASDDFASFSEFKQLVSSLRSSDLSLFATCVTHIQRLTKLMGDRIQDDDLISAIKRIDRQKRSLGDITGKVNTPIAENSKI